MVMENGYDDLRAVGDPTRNAWLEKLARFGIATKGVVYVILGVLAVMAAAGTSDGRITDAGGVVRLLGRQPFGTALLAAAAVGLAGYTLWRFAQAAFDPDGVGSDLKGVAKRAGYAVSGLIYGALALGVAQSLVGVRRGGASPRSWLGTLLSEGSAGVAAVAVVGVAVGGVAVAQFGQAVTAGFMRELDTGAMGHTARTWIERAGRVGHAARGVVLAILAWFLVRVAVQSDSSEWQGSDGALREIAQQEQGTLLLGVVAAGLAAFGAYQITVARYRKIGQR
ncbi:MAG: DUF1206 domain-containing protein [Deltaproteobacteria bacterium]|nr:DUF1206 domain-containing protein [Myxococcales bacterium]MDP3220875.1 DUF1206 domain-containing protein [Deltaproteobacteria bacterium]